MPPPPPGFLSDIQNLAPRIGVRLSNRLGNTFVVIECMGVPILQNISIYWYTCAKAKLMIYIKHFKYLFCLKMTCKGHLFTQKLLFISSFFCCFGRFFSPSCALHLFWMPFQQVVHDYLKNIKETTKYHFNFGGVTFSFYFFFFFFLRFNTNRNFYYFNIF